MEYHTRRVGTNILLIRDGKILLPRRANTGWADGKLAIPGGHLEEGETPRQAAIRELKEELGLDITEDRLEFYSVAAVRTNHEYIYFEFYVELMEGEEPINQEPDRCSELVWCVADDLPSDVQETFDTIIKEGFVARKPYFEIGYAQGGAA